MTEKEKMLTGEFYKGSDDELLSIKQKAQERLYIINGMNPVKIVERHNLLYKLFEKIGENTWFEIPFNCDYGGNISIGSNCYFNHHCTIDDSAKIKIGDNVLFGPYVGVYSSGHPLDVKERIQGWQYAKSISIGNNVWIEANVTILPGVKIGDNTVIGACSVVTKDIPSNVLAYGNPCKVAKKI